MAREASDELLKNSPFDAFPIAPARPQYELDFVDRANREVSRRTMLRAGASTVATLCVPPMLVSEFLATDQAISESLQQQPTEVRFTDIRARYRHPRTALLALPGFNVYDGERIAKAIAPSVSEFAQVACVRFGNAAFSPSVIQDETEKFLEANGIEELYFYCHSMSGMLGMDMATRLHDRGVKIKGIFDDCSPTSHKDVKTLDDRGFDLVNFANYMSMYGGIATRYLVEAGINKLNRDQNLAEAFQNARRVLTTEACSTTMVAQQISYMYYFDLAERLESLPRDIPIAYLGPDDARRDGTINNDTAYNRLARERQSYDFTRRCRLPGTTHASVGADQEVYNRNVRAIHREFMVDAA